MEAQSNAGPAAAIRRWLWLAACACAALLAPAAHAQWGDPIGPQYELAVFLKDLESANCRVPREQAVAAFERFAREDARLRMQRVAEALAAWEDDSGAWPSMARMQRIVRIYQHAGTAVSASEQRLFDDLSASAPDGLRAEVEAARSIRAAGRTQEILDTCTNMLSRERPVDAASLFRFQPEHGVRTATGAALVRTAQQRAEAADALIEAIHRGMVESCKEAEKQQLTGVDMNMAWQEAALADMLEADAKQRAKAAARKTQATPAEGEGAAPSEEQEEEEEAGSEGSHQEQLMQRYETVRRRVEESAAEKLDAYNDLQWRVAVEASAALPPVCRHDLLVQAAAIIYPELGFGWEGGREEIIGFFRHPSPPAGCLDKVKKAAQAWATEDVELIVEGVRKLASLRSVSRSSSRDHSAVEAMSQELQDARSKLLDALQHATEGCLPKAEEAADELPPEAQAIWHELTGENQDERKIAEDSGSERFDEDDGSDGRDQAAYGLPAEDSLAMRLQNLGLGDDAVAVALQLRTDTKQAWDEKVAPLDGKVEDMSGRLRWGALSETQRDQLTVELSAALEQIGQAAKSVRSGFVDSLLASLSDRLTPAQASVLRMDLEFGNPRRDPTRFWSADNEWAGGLRINPAEVVIGARLSPAELDVAVDVLQTAAPRLAEAQKAHNQALHEFEATQRAYEDVTSRGTMSNLERWNQQQALGERLSKMNDEGARKVDALRTMAEGVIEEICSKVSPEAADRLRRVREERSFPSFYLPEALVERACEQMRLGRTEDTPEWAALARAKGAFAELAFPARTAAIACSKEMRGIGMGNKGRGKRGRSKEEWRHDSVMMVSSWQGMTALTAFVERLRATFPSDELRRSAAVRQMARMTSVVLVDLPWGGPRSQPVEKPAATVEPAEPADAAKPAEPAKPKGPWPPDV